MNFVLANGFIIHAVHLLKQWGHNITQKLVFTTTVWQEPQYLLVEHTFKYDFQVIGDPFCFSLVYLFFPVSLKMIVNC